MPSGRTVANRPGDAHAPRSAEGLPESPSQPDAACTGEVGLLSLNAGTRDQVSGFRGAPLLIGESSE